jgi:ERCC4-type nuclease
MIQFRQTIISILMELIIDDRERAIYPHLTTEAQSIKYRKDRLEVGDYALVRGTEIIAIFERKSLEDYAASIKDGRHANKEKLLTLRDKTGCRAFYIVEGKRPKTLDKYIGGIAYTTIESSMFHLMMRDGIFIIHTLNTQDTVAALVRFIRSMENLEGKRQAMVCGLPGNNVDLLKEKTQKTELDIAREMWACFSGISSVSADAFINRYNLRQIVSEQIPLSELKAIKYSNGRAINKKVVNSLSEINKRIQVRLLSCVPGISGSTAEEILDTRKLKDILSYETGAISIIPFGKHKKPLGLAKAEAIKKHFEFTLAKKEAVTTEPPITQPELPKYIPPLTSDDIKQINDFLNSL